jgi:hypothetical protein
MNPKRVVKIPPPPFMQGGAVVAGDITVRNPAGYPIDADGKIDIEAMKRESQAYYSKAHAVKFSNKKSNYTPPKKKRK